ncbi:DUF5710 domain-containing protein [Quatrionicoccus australiensis]|uniref:DUF5710 domain-containing protein n=1 Tax=Quatrionicoccus australiensis TaxID=138118 RepID=UPI001CFAD7EF|nr:DUF5710 domain-containing protein [Quatrionicoccus australiensis]MCB4359606.1 hypothetical protein [Quatrionicoccus australiensis]
MTALLSFIFWSACIVTSTFISASYGVLYYTIAVAVWGGLLATCFTRTALTGALAIVAAGTAYYAWPAATAAELRAAVLTSSALYIVGGFMVLVAVQGAYERFMASDKARNYKPHDDEVGTRWLNVPYEDKEHAKALGARWSGLAKKWYIPAGLDAERFERWLP